MIAMVSLMFSAQYGVTVLFKLSLSRCITYLVNLDVSCLLTCITYFTGCLSQADLVLGNFLADLLVTSVPTSLLLYRQMNL